MKYTDEIRISTGLIRGMVDEKNNINIFKGIPYGKAPVGELRFKPTVVADNWTGVKDCVSFGKSAIQEEQKPFMFWSEEFVIGDYGYSEDCLNLNIWVKNDGQKNKPVIVYFHGGRFVSGGSSCENYDGSAFAKNGIVFLSFNHRVATLAQLSTREIYEESGKVNSGNYNLMDEITLLKWVRDNIEAFGGNPDNVILMGQSSGAGEVNALTVCEQAKGLFKRVISLSYNSYLGSIAEIGWKELEDAFKQGEELTEAKSLKELRAMPAMEFVSKPPIDTMRVDGNLLKAQFNTLVDEGANKDTDVIFGAVPGDWLICSPFYHKNTEKKEDVIQYLKDFFKDNYDEAAAHYDIDNTDKNILIPKINNDYIISCMLLYAKARNKFQSGKTYVYYYKHILPGPENGAYGVFHSSELPYFFNYFTDKRRDYYKKEDFELGQKINDMMSDYSKGESLEKYGWYPTEETNYLLISDEGLKEEHFDENVLEMYRKGFGLS